MTPGLTYTHPDGTEISLLVSPAGRLVAQVVDAVLICLTAGLGWLIWALFLFGRGQTPARQIMGHTIADARTGHPLAFWRMAYRELLIKLILGALIGAATFGLYPVVDSLFVFSDRNRTLHDKIAGTVVIHR
ncbi:RDD family protein [Actinoplanes sp. L3-i22]|uniref:RDD family protein n=1 Tax=Actinoplanes sp. L3-i22 TaxID=2836373 RepID=UPI001C742377|nr:RDD family protein [Actinoplanes sp. L3-i22]BCY08017.1 hypothetical protein L3i22_031050 [Actinoplanes sp. L3-i22]